MIQPEDFDGLSEVEFTELEQQTERLVAVWEIKNLRGQNAIFHDDQRIGEKRRQLFSVQHPSVDPAKVTAIPGPLVDNLEGNSLVHPLTTCVIEIDPTCTKARGVWASFGVEALAKHREQPQAIVSLGYIPGAHVKEGGEWRILWGVWQRTTKNEYHAGWVHSMEPTNARPALTPEQDRAWLGKYAYQKNEIRQPVPAPPRHDTWSQFPDESDENWKLLNLI